MAWSWLAACPLAWVALFALSISEAGLASPIFRMSKNSTSKLCGSDSSCSVPKPMRTRNLQARSIWWNRDAFSLPKPAFMLLALVSHAQPGAYTHGERPLDPAEPVGVAN